MSAGWSDRRPDDLRPVVLVLGGFLTSPPFYRPFVRRLFDRGAADVVVAPVWTPDWAAAAAYGLRPVVRRSARALDVATARSAAEADGAPVLVVGHSAGGLVARLLTAPEPFLGLRLARSEQIGAIVTLGSPHGAVVGGLFGRRIHRLAVDFCDRVVPGCAFAPGTAYLTVGSSNLRGRRRGSGAERVAGLLYSGIVGRTHDPDGLEGDGLVPVVASSLTGAPHIVLDRLGHGVGPGGPWYGSDEGIDQWWPQALEAWREALRTRAAVGPGRTRV
jgi:hypothetical protein